ncbi:hypothetical protein EMIHUDRAFT_455441 [Emiliania huxleyi CCMP1516]|uniref:protein-tyrosine-phosphatase n=2 Tax=Emiliania huxleyi TaxID=2903 RepID=A0A0D3KGT8_EMIH1|nr:hypothetical protein EMIHUDRAFT_455441 [Emiliania huxleyi CCMP1516]EOD34973.1 hypothetical protein EMIHUDRAFT_455441 [Emiliania huxleyi CCMP1516]|eukprot:XP_005787402.1 hypothetical protein EMIHUDRAFT_455441 [Emiliania huxleyi CCMP1516]
MSQASAATFSSTPQGHPFCLRVPLAKATANRCAGCGLDIRRHSREEVTDEQLLADDGKSSVVLPGELAVGSYKAALAVCREEHATNAVLNCAGYRLHAFLPATRAAFDRLRLESPPRLLDLEWEDSEAFRIPLEDLERGLAWASDRVRAGQMVLVNCAQGKSRSGTMAVAYVMRRLNLPVEEALTRVQQARPLVEPNSAFLEALRAFEGEIRAGGASLPAVLV